jgi:hypothetical protein
VRVIVLDREAHNPWIRSLQQWADTHQSLGHEADDSRASIHGGTIHDPR